MNNAQRAYEAGVKLAYANFMSKLADPQRDDYNFTEEEVYGPQTPSQVPADDYNFTEEDVYGGRVDPQPELDEEIYYDPQASQEDRDAAGRRMLSRGPRITDQQAADLRIVTPERETAQQLLARIQSQPQRIQQNLVSPTLNAYSDPMRGMQAPDADIITGARMQADADTTIRGVRNSVAAGRPGLETMFGNLDRAMGTRFIDSVDLQTPKGRQINMGRGDVRRQYQSAAPQFQPVPKSFSAQLPSRLPTQSPLNTSQMLANLRASRGVQKPIQPKPMGRLTAQTPNTGFMNNMQMKQISRG